MDGRPHRSCKKKRDPDFIYEDDNCEDSVNSSNSSDSSADIRTQTFGNNHSNTFSSNNAEWQFSTAGSVSVSNVLNNLPVFSDFSVFNNSLNPSSGATISKDKSQRQCHRTNSQSQPSTASESDQFGFSNVNKAEGRTIRKYSSTRGDFLDLPGNFMSVGSSSVISEMSGSEN